MAVAPDLCGCALDGRYELRALIGEGAFGRVYRGFDRRLARDVAVKVIKPWWSEDPEWVRRFEREAQLLARLADPGIVQIFDVGHAPEGLYYVAELVDGESLAKRVQRGALPAAEACEIAQALCSALAQAHSRRIVHRDIKPGNVLLAAGGEAKVADFGVALLADATSDGASSTIVGTPRYMAPEQGQGRPATPATDVYSVGVVLYEMLAGRPPFTGDSPVELALRHLRDPPPPLAPSIPAALRSVVERALAKDPANRYRDGGEMARALASARPARARERPREETSTWVAPPLSPRRNFNPAARRRSMVLLTGVAVLLIGMVAAAIAIGRSSKVRVPAVTGLSSALAVKTLKHGGLRPELSARYARASARTAIAQSPRAGATVDTGTAVQVVLSAGPPPVALPRLSGDSAADARRTLESLGLHVSISQVPAPGQQPETVLSQSPGTGASLLPGATVSLQAAEWPRWRPVLRFAGDAGGESPGFQIRGTQWRVVYDMSYRGICSWVSAFCSDPTVAVERSGASLGTLDLGEGSDQAQTIDSGPGQYRLNVVPGDDASWSIVVEDYY